MPDISLCTNNKCPRIRDCYRQTAIADRTQSYTWFEAEGCTKFINNRNR